ncbi:hypothetical protein T265_09673 [Opisthorchis viverrini]|uniref:Uncharacterized protein n=1 Tax=Opisthorchis viverrini TaxID=6198 RepID=A0A074Z9E3_OPIVI|nr:hypothetical protein T265_09673 [Opisthorchis viverrini]KER22167.1 hypothetical protein T265_09673 [Opisthorchis viverrini]
MDRVGIPDEHRFVYGSFWKALRILLHVRNSENTLQTLVWLKIANKRSPLSLIDAPYPHVKLFSTIAARFVPFTTVFDVAVLKQIEIKSLFCTANSAPFRFTVNFLLIHGLPIYTVCPSPIQYIVRCPIATTEETQVKFVEIGFAAIITDRPSITALAQDRAASTRIDLLTVLGFARPHYIRSFLGERHCFSYVPVSTGTRVIIIIIDSMTSVFNTDASLPYNHDLFKSLIVKKRVKVDGEGTYD